MKDNPYLISLDSQPRVGIIFFKNLGLVPFLQLCSEDFLSLEGVRVEEDLEGVSLSWTTSGRGDSNLIAGWEGLSGAEWAHLLEITYPPVDGSSLNWTTRPRNPLSLKLRHLTQTQYQKEAGSLVKNPLMSEWSREVHHLLVAKTQWVLERECSGGNWTLEQMVKEFLRSQKLGTLGI